MRHVAKYMPLQHNGLGCASLCNNKFLFLTFLLKNKESEALLQQWNKLCRTVVLVSKFTIGFC